MKPLLPAPTIKQQRGAAFMVMLVILVMGVSFFLVSALSKVSLQIARNERSSDMLVLAKETVIGNIVMGVGQRPGDTLRPDSFATTEAPPDYDGTAETGCLNVLNAPSGLPLTGTVANMRCLGRLPWKGHVDLGLSGFGLSIEAPSENDPSGFMPWYAVSTNLVDPAGVTFNSELLNVAPHPWLTVRDMNGNVLSNRVAFIIFVPGAALPFQSRPASPNLGGADQYLDSITVPAGCAAPCTPSVTYRNFDLDDDYIKGEDKRWVNDPANPGKQMEDITYQFNDKLIYVTIDELMPLIEKRIAREVKACLDEYAAAPVPTNGNLPSWKYPWATPITDIATYATTNGTRFGRIPSQPTVNTVSPLSKNNATDNSITALFTALTALDNAVENCQDSGNNQAALALAGQQLVTAATTVANNQPTVPAIDSTITSLAITAGNKAQTVSTPTRCEKIHTNSSTTVQTNMQNVLNGLSGINVLLPEDSSMNIAWPAGCFDSGNMSTYWGDWRNLVLYQVSDNFRPRPPSFPVAACGGTATCLSINGNGNANAGSGSYRAAIVMAGKRIGLQTRAAQTVDQYLELNNQTNKPANLTFETYKTSDPNYSTVNDMVLCLDGRNNCR